MPDVHECIHEDMLMGQSRAIERLDAELAYKKERLDDLKEDNKRMENKIDEIKDCVNKMAKQSDVNDSKLELRLTKIETNHENLEKKIETNRKEDNSRINRLLTVVGVGVSIAMLGINIIFHFI